MDYRNIRKSKGWIYNGILPALQLEYRMLFRKIFVHNPKGVPANKPVLIAANHPTAFIDPILIATLFDPPVYNMTRGDVFKKPFFRKLMEQCNMFPVYRQRDGYAGRNRNDEVFEYCQQKLMEGVAVNIFVEGEHHKEKRVQTLQKGIARIAFGTYQNHPLEDLQIVPVGCNYIAGDALRDEVKIIVGEPIFVKDYWASYQESPGVAVNTLCTDIRNALLSLCYHIEDSNDDTLAEQLLTLWRNDHPSKMIPILEHNIERFQEEKKVLERLNTMLAEEKKSLRVQSSAYFKALKESRVNDETLQQPGQGSWPWLLFFVLGFLPFLLGFVMRWPISSLAEYVANKKVKKREFYTSIWLGVSTVSSAIYYPTLLLLGFIMGWPILISIAIMLPVLGWFSIFWRERLIHWWSAQRALRHPERERLLAMRSTLSQHY